MKTKFHAGSEPVKKVNLLRRVLGQPVIFAGGSLRDDYMGQYDMISDYDIFLQGNNVSHYVLAGDRLDPLIETIISKVFPNNDDYCELFGSEYLTPTEQASRSDSKQGANDQIIGVWEIDDTGVLYQLIFTKEDPVTHLNKYFDVGFCKAYCDGKKIRYTDDFLYDVKHKQLTIVGDDMSKDQVLYTIEHHCEKIQWKYGNFRIVVPPRYQKFVEGAGFPTC